MGILKHGFVQSENLILAAVTPGEFEHLQTLLESYPLRMRENLQEAGEAPDWVYFPMNGIVSVLTVLENGMMIEFATVGREGTTGIPLFVGLDHSNLTLVSQMPGMAMRMRARDFMAELHRSPGFATATVCTVRVMSQRWRIGGVQPPNR